MYFMYNTILNLQFYNLNTKILYKQLKWFYFMSLKCKIILCKINFLYTTNVNNITEWS